MRKSNNLHDNSPNLSHADTIFGDVACKRYSESMSAQPVVSHSQKHKRSKFMKRLSVISSRSNLGRQLRFACSAAVLFGVGVSLGDDVMRINETSVSNGKLEINWVGSADSFEVQRSDSLGSSGWQAVLATARTNAAIPLASQASFFRVVNPKTNGVTLLMSITNLSDGQWLTSTLLPQTNADLVFNIPTNSGGGGSFPVVYPYAEQRKFDVWLDHDGVYTQFKLAPTNGASPTTGGWWMTSPGPGLTEVTYDGLVTNESGVFGFSAVTDPSPEGTAGQAAGGFAGALVCLFNGGYQVSQLRCQAACTTRAIACGFQGKAADCKWVSQITWNSNYSQVTCTGYCDDKGCK